MRGFVIFFPERLQRLLLRTSTVSPVQEKKQSQKERRQKKADQNRQANYVHAQRTFSSQDQALKDNEGCMLEGISSARHSDSSNKYF